MSILSKYNINIALLHYPIKDKNSNVITTAVTNFDIHDIARISASIGFCNYYIITPIKEQHALVNRITEHWIKGNSKNIARKKALSKIKLAYSLEDAIDKINVNSNKKVKTIVTSAKDYNDSISIDKLVSKLNLDFSYLLIFGTGWGIDENIINKSDYILNAIKYDTEYNHLSVRSAVSIIADRLYNRVVNGK